MLLNQSFDDRKAEITKLHSLLVVRAHGLGEAHVLVALGNSCASLVTLTALKLFHLLFQRIDHLLVVSQRLRVCILEEAEFAG